MTPGISLWEHLKVFVEVEVTTILSLGLRLGSGILVLLLGTSHDTSLLVITNTLFKEVGLAGERDVLHEVKWVGRLVVFVIAESKEKTIGNEFDILLHQVGVHAKESARKSLSQELLLDFDSFGDNILNSLLAWAVLQVREEKAGEVGVETLVTGDQFIGECKASHQTTLLQPEDGSK
jgi:hypothetical protein